MLLRVLWLVLNTIIVTTDRISKGLKYKCKKQNSKNLEKIKVLYSLMIGKDFLSKTQNTKPTIKKKIAKTSNSAHWNAFKKVKRQPTKWEKTCHTYVTNNLYIKINL